MNWTSLLKGEIGYAYAVTDGLMKLVDDKKLGWKPATGSNWMTTGQLLMHLTNACGAGCKGFVTGDWGFPAGVDPSKLPPEEMLPPAEKLPAVETVAQARKLLAEDKALALKMVDQAGEQALDTRIAIAPWDPMQLILGLRLLQMVNHLTQHKDQLYYYLKLQGQPVNTGNLWGAR